MPTSKPSSIIHVEDAFPEKGLEAAPSLEQTYMESELSRDDAYFLANFPEEKRNKCIRKVSWIMCLICDSSGITLVSIDRLASLPHAGVSLPCLLY
jgi:hypothetical protein